MPETKLDKSPEEEKKKRSFEQFFLHGPCYQISSVDSDPVFDKVDRTSIKTLFAVADFRDFNAKSFISFFPNLELALLIGSKNLTPKRLRDLLNLEDNTLHLVLAPYFGSEIFLTDFAKCKFIKC
jgi:hypothetical protein